jgi:hypothetical protein
MGSVEVTWSVRALFGRSLVLKLPEELLDFLFTAYFPKDGSSQKRRMIRSDRYYLGIQEDNDNQYVNGIMFGVDHVRPEF